MKVILASSSPRRIELINKLGCEFQVIKPEIDESFDDRLTLEDNLISVAANKALNVKSKAENETYDVILSADTIVILDNTAIGKPKNADDARTILKMLSDKTHLVMSAVCILSKEKSLTFCEKTYVTFSKLNDNEIEKYIATGEPLDKAGAYGVQDTGALFISRIEGCYYNVMGFPVNRIYNMLKDEFNFIL